MSRAGSRGRTGALSNRRHRDDSADRDHLYNPWNALANLADMAGEVSVIIRADSDQGVDRSKLQNGVLEPLWEADLIE